MSTDSTSIALSAILDALTLVQDQLDGLTDRCQRIEATHQEILPRLDRIAAAQQEMLTRLDTIDAGQAAVTDLTPILETILGRTIDDSEIMKKRLGMIATAIGFAHAAANGNRAPLPVSVASDPLLERFILTQPADLVSNERALADWRKAASAASVAELADLLQRQYQPSPTDTPETRVLRYRLAAITRAEIKRRGGDLPAPPTTTKSADRSAVTCLLRSQELAALWRAGESTALYAEPELAGAVDLFVQAERRVGPTVGEDVPPELVALHQELALLIETNHRLSSADTLSPDFGEPAKTVGTAKAVESDKDR